MIPEDLKKTEENILRYRDRISNFSKDFEIGLFIYLLGKVKWIILLSFLALFFGAFIYMRYTPKMYETNTTIQINIKEQADEFLDIYSYQQQTNINSEVELMKSQKIINKTIQNLNSEIQYYSEGDILTRDLYKRSPFKLVDFKLKNLSLSSSPLYISFDNEYFKITNSTKSITYAEYIKNNSFFSNEHFSGKLIISGTLNSFIESLNNYNYYFIIPTLIERRLEITEHLEINILDYAANTIGVSYKHTNPIYAQDVCNEIAKSYIDYDLTKKAISSVKIVEFINAQKDSVDVRLKDSEREIQIFKKENNVKSSDIRKQSSLSQLDELENIIIQNQVDIELLEQFNSMFKNSVSSEINYNSIKGLLLSKDVTSNNENMIILNNEIEEQIIYMRKAIKMIKQHKIKKNKELNQKIRLIERKLLSLPEKELELTRLERIHEINNKYYTLLLEKETEYELSKAGITTYNEILKPAPLNEQAISPKPILAYSLAGVLAFIISALIALINYLTHDKITSLHEISKYSEGSIGILGMVPLLKTKPEVSQLIVDKSPKSMVTESFRALRTNLQFINNEKSSKIIAISSTISGEGKTFLAINLAGIIAFTGKKVVIIDLDMRKPKIHIGFGVKNDKGMSEILVGKNQISDCIKNSLLKNLDFITAGTLPPNPSELIVSNEFENTINKLKKNYDLIVIDNPPVGLVTDGIPVLNMSDYPIYVFKANFSRKNFIQNVDRLINENNLSKLSVVLNGVESNNRGYGSKYGYGYGYGYGFGYGYGYGSKAYTSYYSDDSFLNKKSIFDRLLSMFKSNGSKKDQN